MSDSNPEVGTVGWMDLTVDDAPGVRDFYTKVVGWKPEEVPMGDYADFTMTTPTTGTATAGVCHARGGNAGLPAQWLIYITVADLDASVATCTTAGGTVVLGPKTIEGMGRYAIIQDPAGASAGLFEHAEKEDG